MKFAEIENKSIQELIKQKQGLTTHLFDLKMKNSVGQISNPLQIRVVRKDIARINTAIAKQGVR